MELNNNLPPGFQLLDNGKWATNAVAIRAALTEAGVPKGRFVVATPWQMAAAWFAVQGGANPLDSWGALVKAGQREIGHVTGEPLYVAMARYIGGFTGSQTHTPEPSVVTDPLNLGLDLPIGPPTIYGTVGGVDYKTGKPADPVLIEWMNTRTPSGTMLPKKAPGPLTPEWSPPTTAKSAGRAGPIVLTVAAALGAVLLFGRRR